MPIALMFLAGFTRASAASPPFTDADWVSLGAMPGADGSVYAMLRDPNSGALYVGGSFNVLGTAVVGRVAKWGGTSWSSLGSGLGGTIRALALDGTGNLYAGGAFTAVAGTNVSAYLAQANVLPISKLRRNSDGSMTFNLLTTLNTSSRVLAATNPAPPVTWQPIGTNVAPANGAWEFTDTNASYYRARFYRSSTPRD